MRRSWKPQVRSFFLNRVPFWLCLGIVAATVFYFLNEKFGIYVSGWVIAAYFSAAVWNFTDLRLWKACGYEKITIDTDKRAIIFDDKTEINMKDIYSINYTVINNPTTPFIFRRDIFDNGRISLLRINAELQINAPYNNIDFAIQNKLDAFFILRMLTKCGLKVTKSDYRTFNVMFAIKMTILLALLAVVVMLYLRSRS